MVGTSHFLRKLTPVLEIRDQVSSLLDTLRIRQNTKKTYQSSALRYLDIFMEGLKETITSVSEDNIHGIKHCKDGCFATVFALVYTVYTDTFSI